MKINLLSIVLLFLFCFIQEIASIDVDSFSIFIVSCQDNYGKRQLIESTWINDIKDYSSVSYFFLITNDDDYCYNRKSDSERKYVPDKYPVSNTMQFDEDNPHYVTIENSISSELLTTINSLLSQKPNKWFVIIPDSLFVRVNELFRCINNLDSDITVYYSPSLNPLLKQSEKKLQVLLKAVYIIHTYRYITLFSDISPNYELSDSIAFYIQSHGYKVQQSSLLLLGCSYDNWIFDLMNPNIKISTQQYIDYKQKNTYICNTYSNKNIRIETNSYESMPFFLSSLKSRVSLVILWFALLFFIFIYLYKKKRLCCFRRHNRGKKYNDSKTIGLPRYTNDPLGPIFQPVSRKRQPY